MPKQGSHSRGVISHLPDRFSYLAWQSAAMRTRSRPINAELATPPVNALRPPPPSAAGESQGPAPGATEAPHANLPVELIDCALVDARTCAAVGDMSISWWFAEVRAGRAPQPVIRGVRCSRWRLVDIRDYWKARAASPMGTPIGGHR